MTRHSKTKPLVLNQPKLRNRGMSNVPHTNMLANKDVKESIKQTPELTPPNEPSSSESTRSTPVQPPSSVIAVTCPTAPPALPPSVSYSVAASGSHPNSAPPQPASAPPPLKGPSPLNPPSLPALNPDIAGRTFANITSQDAPLQPKNYKELGVIFESVNGLSILDYVLAVRELVPANEIQFASRISQNRVCFFFTNIECVDKFVDEIGGIKIKTHFVSVRRMILRTEKLILSNVMPFIPNSMIERELSSLVKIASPITFSSVGFKDPTLAHIKSFRRQVLIEKQATPLPSSILIFYDGEEHRIFISSEVQNNKCFKCQSEDHISRNCPSQLQNRLKNININAPKNDQLENLTNQPVEILQKNPSGPSEPSKGPGHTAPSGAFEASLVGKADIINVNPIIDGEIEVQQNIKTTPGTKDPPPTTDEEKSEQKRKRGSLSPPVDHPRNKEAKKEKREKMKLKEEEEKLSEAVKNTLIDFKIDLSATDILSLLSKTKNSKKPLELIEPLVDDVQTFGKFIKEASLCPLPKNTKARLDRLARALRESISSSDDDTVSDSDPSSCTDSP